MILHLKVFANRLLVIFVFFVQIALPHVNLLSKVDLVEKFGRLQFGLDYYTEVSISIHTYEYSNVQVHMKTLLKHPSSYEYSTETSKFI